ncbi:PrgI family protein [Candidatus Saccharibacteria bacterium]|nr:PrgI family protein [Candidatus Saccharibacteria bacterium]
MGTYKVIQDIEAEDKLLGPLSLRQFIYAIIVVVSFFIGFKMVTAPGIIKYFVILLVPHVVFFAVLAAPFGHDQSNEVWLLAKIRFFFKPRKRIWDQTGMKELVTITVPKVVEKHLTKSFSQDEARNRLKALANTLDSRGWAVKNVSENMFRQPAFGVVSSDRLIDLSNISSQVPDYDVDPSADILDDMQNPASQNMTQLMNASNQQHHQQLVDMMQQGSSVQPVPTANTPQPNTQDDNIDWFSPESVSPEELAITATSDTPPTAQISGQNQPIQQAESQAVSPVTSTPDPAIINLAVNDDLDVATIARQADKTKQSNKSINQMGDDEVVISLH